MTGTIEGTVTDENSDGLADATVTITDSATDAVEAETTTDANGDYSATVDPDTYDVRAEKLEYEPDEETEVTVSDGETVTVDLTLTKLGPKVLGKLTENAGIGVVGRVAVADGHPIGVKGEVDDEEGYGIYSPDDVSIEGTIDTNETDFVVEAGTTATAHARNVIQGHAANQVIDGAVGTTIGGGGFDDGSSTQPNVIHDDYGTIGGGLLNRAGSDDGDPKTARFATVGGGVRNVASNSQATVGGGNANIASGIEATVSGGQSNEASGTYASVSGGEGNDARGDESTVSGGGDNTADANQATVGGGDNNTADAQEATVSGGTGNLASGPRGTVAGGTGNQATGNKAFIGGGDTNVAGDYNAVVAGGFENTASAKATAIGGGAYNEVSARRATVGGGVNNLASAEKATVGGGEHNTVAAKWATIAGGGPSDPSNPSTTNNVVYDNYGTIGGGGNNQAGTDDGDPTTARRATVGGGAYNEASDLGATVGGGSDNTASGGAATVGGGRDNTASGNLATVAGGFVNTASGGGATVPGGAHGAAEDNISFVWNDDTAYHSIPNSVNGGLSSSKAVDGEPVTGRNTFSVSARDGVRFITGPSQVTYIEGGTAGWSTTSSRSVKSNIDPVDPQQVLAGVDDLEVATWEYNGDDDDGDGQGTRHIGPMAEDFHEIVDVGSSDEHINSINADGVLFAAVQGLSEELDEKDDRIDDLERENEQLRDRLAALEAYVGLNEVDPAAAED